MSLIHRPLSDVEDVEDWYESSELIFCDWKAVNPEVFEEQVELLDNIGVDVILYEFDGDAILYTFKQR